jgi:hypothetical protein
MGLVGCGPQMTPFKVVVEADPSLQGKSVAVHIVGVNAKDLDAWNTYPMSKYWAPGNTFHESATVYDKILFDATRPNVQTLDIPSEYWKKWMAEGDTYLFVLANLPGFHEDRAGAADARRQVIDINNSVYENNLSSHEVKVLVTGDRIRVLTPLKPQKQ